MEAHKHAHAIYTALNSLTSAGVNKAVPSVATSKTTICCRGTGSWERRWWPMTGCLEDEAKLLPESAPPRRWTAADVTCQEVFVQRIGYIWICNV